MTHIDQIIADALAGSPETDVAILAREVVRLRGSALGLGEIGVNPGAIELLGVFFDQRLQVEWEPEKISLDDLSRWAKEARDAVAALRANQGGADHA
ncbi:MAG TPA: hypothetical protein PKO15_12730 [Fibrobacteria bacterium]|nr:hypothetical protein [Fibrobacteria bacterium]